MTSELKCIHKIGDLSAQHLVHVMCLIGLIPPSYGMEATICMGSRTEKKLRAKYGIPKSSYPCLLEYVSTEMEITKPVAENGTCKSIQPENTIFRDSIEHDQQSVFWVDKHKGEPRVHYVFF